MRRVRYNHPHGLPAACLKTLATILERPELDALEHLKAITLRRIEELDQLIERSLQPIPDAREEVLQFVQNLRHCLSTWPVPEELVPHCEAISKTHLLKFDQGSPLVPIPMEGAHQELPQIQLLIGEMIDLIGPRREVRHEVAMARSPGLEPSAVSAESLPCWRLLLAERVKSERNKRRMTQAKLAGEIGCSPSTVSRFEHSQIRSPQFEWRFKEFVDENE